MSQTCKCVSGAEAPDDHPTYNESIAAAVQGGRAPLVCSFPRFVAETWSRHLDSRKWVWISFSEPDEPQTISANSILDALPKLKMAIWDLKEEIEYKGKTVGPPNVYQIGRIVNFLKKHEGKNVLVNCAMGVSRSGAVAKFCEECLGYRWSKSCKDLALPNEIIFKDLKAAHYLPDPIRAVRDAIKEFPDTSPEKLIFPVLKVLKGRANPKALMQIVREECGKVI